MNNFENAICPHCAAPNSAMADFCEKCEAPLTSHATTDPMGSIFAEGFAVRQAVNQPQKPIVVVGIWLWMVPIASVWLVGTIFALASVVNAMIEFDIIVLIGSVLAASVSVVILWVAVSIMWRTAQKSVGPPPPAELRTAMSPDDDRFAEKKFAETTADREVETCLACKEPLPPGAVECAECGWTYH